MTGASATPHSQDLARPPASDVALLDRAKAAALESQNAGFLAIDCVGRICALDERAREILIAHGRPYPKTLLEIVDFDGQRQLQRVLRDLRANLTRSCHLDLELRSPMRATQFVRLSLSASSGDCGDVTHVLATLTDTTAREVFELQRRREEKRLRATVDNVAVGIISTDWNGQFLEVNRQFARMLDHAPAVFAGKNFRDFMHPDDITAHSSRRADLWRGVIPSVTIDRRWIKRDGGIIWARMTISVQDDLLDSEPYSVVILEDITEAKRIEESQALLVGELNHRVKNTLAVVQGIVRRTLATAPSPAAFATQIEQRLQSISRAHDLLSRSDWLDLGLCDLVQTSLLDAFPVHAAAFDIRVPNVGLSPHQAITLTLILHELATNALKYGALSAENGRIALAGRWLDPPTAGPTTDPRIELTWTETGGPHTQPSEHRGFGNFLLNRGVTHSLNGEAKTTFDSSGLVFTLSFPIATSRLQTTTTSRDDSPALTATADGFRPAQSDGAPHALKY